MRIFPDESYIGHGQWRDIAHTGLVRRETLRKILSLMSLALATGVLLILFCLPSHAKVLIFTRANNTPVGVVSGQVVTFHSLCLADRGVMDKGTRIFMANNLWVDVKEDIKEVEMQVNEGQKWDKGQ